MALTRPCNECGAPVKPGFTFCPLCKKARNAASKRRYYLNKVKPKVTA